MDHELYGKSLTVSCSMITKGHWNGGLTCKTWLEQGDQLVNRVGRVVKASNVSKAYGIA